MKDNIASAAGSISISDITQPQEGKLDLTKSSLRCYPQDMVRQTLTITFDEMSYGAIDDFIKASRCYTLLPFTPDVPIRNEIRTAAVGKTVNDPKDIWQMKGESIFDAATSLWQRNGEINFTYFFQLDHSGKLWVYVCPENLLYSRLVAKPESLLGHIRVLKSFADTSWNNK